MDFKFLHVPPVISKSQFYNLMFHSIKTTLMEIKLHMCRVQWHLSPIPFCSEDMSVSICATQQAIVQKVFDQRKC